MGGRCVELSPRQVSAAMAEFWQPETTRVERVCFKMCTKCGVQAAGCSNQNISAHTVPYNKPLQPYFCLESLQMIKKELITADLRPFHLH